MVRTHKLHTSAQIERSMRAVPSNKMLKERRTAENDKNIEMEELDFFIFFSLYEMKSPQQYPKQKR